MCTISDVPSGVEIQQLLGDIEQANKEVGDLAGYWKDLLNASLETARKFEVDQRCICNNTQCIKHIVFHSKIQHKNLQ